MRAKSESDSEEAQRSQPHARMRGVSERPAHRVEKATEKVRLFCWNVLFAMYKRLECAQGCVGRDRSNNDCASSTSKLSPSFLRLHPYRFLWLREPRYRERLLARGRHRLRGRA